MVMIEICDDTLAKGGSVAQDQVICNLTDGQMDARRFAP